MSNEEKFWTNKEVSLAERLYVKVMSSQWKEEQWGEINITNAKTAAAWAIKASEAFHEEAQCGGGSIALVGGIPASYDEDGNFLEN